MSIRVSVVILTKNEEADIQECLRSLTDFSEIHVLDSGSNDQTLSLAMKSRAVVATHEFTTFGVQRNWALNNLPLTSEWVLFLDADERATPQFVSAVAKATREASAEVAGFYCCWKMMLEEKWLRRSDSFPKWQLRLLRKDRVRFKDVGHGQKEGEVEGKLDYLREPYLHYGFSKGWGHWVERHNRYSTQEARARISDHYNIRTVFSRHASSRNPALKYFLSRIPGWPVLRFLYAYIFKIGIVEGKLGFIYCVNMAYYEFLIRIKMRELRRSKVCRK